MSDIGSSTPLAPTLYVRTGGVCAIVPRADFQQRNTGVFEIDIYDDDNKCNVTIFECSRQLFFMLGY